MGLVSLGLSLAAWRVASGESGPLAGPGALGEAFLAVNGGLMLLGLGLIVVSAAKEIGRRPAGIIGLVSVAVGLIAIGLLAGEHLAAAGVFRVVAVGAGLGVAGAAVVWVGRKAIGARVFAAPLDLRIAPGHRVAAGVLIAGIAATAAGPHTAVVFLGAIAAAWGGFYLFHVADRIRPVAPAISLLLVPAYWLLATIAGPVGLSLGALPGVPLSPAAERLVAPALLLVAWAISGLWPFHRQLPAAVFGPVGALLLLRVGLPVAPEGIEHWRPLAVPVLVLGLWHAAAWGRWPALAVAGGLIGIVSPSAEGVVGGMLLLAVAVVLELVRWPVVRVVAVVAGAWGGLLALTAGLRGEVVYSVFGVVGLGLILIGRGRAGDEA